MSVRELMLQSAQRVKARENLLVESLLDGKPLLESLSTVSVEHSRMSTEYSGVKNQLSALDIDSGNSSSGKKRKRSSSPSKEVVKRLKFDEQ